MRLFKLDVPIWATAYIKANSAEEALNIANAEMIETGIELSDRHQSVSEAICIDGRPYACLKDNEEDIALSPAMSFDTNRYGIAMIEEVDL